MTPTTHSCHATRFLAGLRLGGPIGAWDPVDFEIRATGLLSQLSPHISARHTWNRPLGRVLAFGDGSAVAFRLTERGWLLGPGAAWMARRWSARKADKILGPLWAAPRPRGGWLDPLDPLDYHGPWNPWFAPSKMRQARERALVSFRALLAHSAGRDLKAWEKSAISMSRLNPQSQVVFDVHPASFFDTDMRTAEGRRGRALSAACARLFPGRLGWSAMWIQTDAGLVVQGCPFVELPALSPLHSAHARLNAIEDIRAVDADVLSLLH